MAAGGLVGRPAAAALLALALAPAATSSPAASGWAPDSARRGAAYIVARQAPSGAFFRADEAANAVAEEIAALAAAGVTGRPVERALAYVARHGPEDANRRGAYAGRIVMGIVAGGRNPRNFGGTDYVGRLSAFYSPVTGSYDNANPGEFPPSLYADALAALGMIAAGEPLEAGALGNFRSNVCADGGYGHARACAEGPDVDTTALVIAVLRAAGVPAGDSGVVSGRQYLIDAGNPDGGFGYAGGAQTNANSTALALSAIAALGEQPRASTWQQSRPSANPLDALLGLQEGAGGFRYTATNDAANDYATVQAVVGAAGTPYPVRPVTPAAVPRPTSSTSTTSTPVATGPAVTGEAPARAVGSGSSSSPPLGAPAPDPPDPAPGRAAAAPVRKAGAVSRGGPIAAAAGTALAAAGTLAVAVMRRRRSTL